MRIKICGITNLADAQAAARAGADYVGLVCVPGPRQVSLAQARHIAAALPPTTQPVLLFRNTPLDELRAAIQATAIRCVQLHGDEPIDYLRDLSVARPDLRLIRAFEVPGLAAADSIRKYLTTACDVRLPLEVVILDAPKAAPHPGYPCLGAVAQRCHRHAAAIWLAGGLTPANVVQALAAGPFDGVDVSRGVETRPGIKDQAAVAQFILRARQPQ